MINLQMVWQVCSNDITMRTLLLLKLLHSKVTFTNMQFQVVFCLGFVTTKITAKFPLHMHIFLVF